MLHFELKPARWTQPSWESLHPACEIIDAEKVFSVSLDIPGFRKEDIEIELKDRHLLVSGTRYATVRPENEKVMRQERRFGHFQRVFNLPEAISEQNISAKFEDGVLEITIPKTEVSARKISIL